ncbi:DUF3606 domain-containing protein [Mucilaginibacter sp.]|uniref:DUF3606 domain-containing protein n=1 Tax=Mucilaginibacter sp. TaxID=1882438 RepID=UPI002618300A|nr:DUF3606 domain-containing protein [Mucilaginibacter sp.]MDB4925368.1 hypothetical protein [Mucilaginibacter sp.]
MERYIKDRLPDNERPGTEEEFELDYWSNEFGISKDELVKAVKSGKTSTEAVEKYVKELQLTPTLAEV